MEEERREEGRRGEGEGEDERRYLKIQDLFFRLFVPAVTVGGVKALLYRVPLKELPSVLLYRPRLYKRGLEERGREASI